MRTIVSCLPVIVCLLAGCTDDKDGTPRPPEECEGGLVFAREDSTTVDFPSTTTTYVWCGNWESDAVPIRSVQVWVGTTDPQPTGWWLKAVVADVELEAPMTFPNYFVWDQPDGVVIFLLDLPNELATDTVDSGGTIVFHSIPCPDGDRIDFTIDAVLGSEYSDMPAVTVCGRFTGEVTGPPPWEDD